MKDTLGSMVSPPGCNSVVFNKLVRRFESFYTEQFNGGRSLIGKVHACEA